MTVICPACGRRVGRLPDGTPETHSRPDIYDTACNGDVDGLVSLGALLTDVGLTQAEIDRAVPPVSDPTRPQEET